MKLLTTASQVNHQLTRLLRECSSCQVAVAWATVGFDAFQRLKNHNGKIARMVVGTSFFQTHPAFIEAFQTHPNVRFVLKTDGVFHPKLYFFEKAGGAWECIIGSPNFTKGGLGGNDEMAVLLTSKDDGAHEALGSIQASIADYWEKASPLNADDLEAYRESWERKRPLLNKLGGKYGNPSKDKGGDKGKPPLEVPNLRMSWATFFQRVKTETGHHTVEGRIDVIRAVKEVLASQPRFSDLDLLGREKVAGLLDQEVGKGNYRWFGSMKGVGKFWTAIKTNDENLSLALDLIPVSGAVTREMYLEYIARYEQAFPQGRHGVGTASRLLAMKRPDCFVCLDKRNKVRLCKDLGIVQTVGYEAYWDSIVARVMDSTWWNSPRPEPGMEREVWEARTAFLDAIYYDGTPF